MNKGITIFRDFLSLVKFSHTIFAMPFALIGFSLGVAEIGSFDWMKLVYVVLCMVFARNSAMGFNRYLDADIDKKNPRTLNREIPAQKISSNKALAFIITNVVLFVATTYFINSLCFYLSPVALIVIMGYSYTKRFTSLCHLVLGLGLSLSPIGAFIAVTGHFGLEAVLFSFVVISWVSGFDIIYALQDASFDKENSLKSIPAFLGEKKALFLSRILHLISASIVIFIGLYFTLSMSFWIGTVIFSGLLVYQHSIVKSNDLSRVNLAFFTTNGIASVVFGVFVIADIIFSNKLIF
ncbi:MAG: UbiA-like polyprenyltransferase [Bacteroidota bacterium]